MGEPDHSATSRPNAWNKFIIPVKNRYQKMQRFRLLSFRILANPVGIAHARCAGMPSDVDNSPGADIRERAFLFGCAIVRFCAELYKSGGIARDMAPQLLNAGTALYPMLEEARAAESTADFISKCCIGLKEVREAHGRLRTHEACQIGSVEDARKLREEANELVSIVTRIIGNTKTNAGISRPRRRSMHYDKTIPS